MTSGYLQARVWGIWEGRLSPSWRSKEWEHAGLSVAVPCTWNSPSITMSEIFCPILQFWVDIVLPLEAPADKGSPFRQQLVFCHNSFRPCGHWVNGCFFPPDCKWESTWLLVSVPSTWCTVVLLVHFVNVQQTSCYRISLLPKKGGSWYSEGPRWV